MEMFHEYLIEVKKAETPESYYYVKGLVTQANGLRGTGLIKNHVM